MCTFYKPYILNQYRRHNIFCFIKFQTFSCFVLLDFIRTLAWSKELAIPSTFPLIILFGPLISIQFFSILDNRRDLGIFEAAVMCYQYCIMKVSLIELYLFGANWDIRDITMIFRPISKCFLNYRQKWTQLIHGK